MINKGGQVRRGTGTAVALPPPASPVTNSTSLCAWQNNILGMNPALPQNLPGHSLPQGMGIGGGGGGGLGGMGMPGMGAQGDLGMGNAMGGQGAGFDLSEFPSLGGGPGSGGRSGMPGMGGGLQQFRSPQAFDLVQAANQAQEPT